MKKTNGCIRTGPHKHDITETNPKKQTPERSTQHSKQPTHGHDMICGMRYAMHMHDCKGMIDPGLNLEIQECHWKGEVISVEIDIKITRIGCADWIRQAKQIWHRSGIISKSPSKCIKINMLQHPNMATKYMAGIHS